MLLSSPVRSTVLLALLAALAATRGGSRAAEAPDAQGEAPKDAVKVRRGPFRAIFESDALFVPADASELSFSPRAYEGELRVAEAAAHGSRVRQGDVILRLEDEKAKDMLRAAEWALRAAERAAIDGKARHDELDSDAERDIARAEKDLALSEKTLKGYIEVSRALEKDEYEQGERSIKHSIADQEDELAQLGKMYKEDQLTEETEEIVLKRARRNLEETRNRLTLYVRRHVYGEEYTEPVQRETLENAVKDKRKALRDLRRGRESGRVLSKIDLEKLEHELGAARKRVERLREDVEHMTLRAPFDGVLIHGGFDEKVAVAPLRRHGSVLPHQTLVTVARPGALKVRFSLKEKDRYRLAAGMGTAILPEALPERRIAGSLEPVSGFPLPDNTWNAHAVFGSDDERLLPLMKAKVVVTLHDSMDSLTVPLAAVFRKGDRALCYLRGKSPFGIVARTVVTGPDDGKTVVIREGLSEGDEVLLQEPLP